MSKKRNARRRTRNVLLIVSMMLVVAMASVGVTVAWLTDTTTTITNTFTSSDINIELAETTGTSYKMVPGATITKDPVATVKANSEACWLFVKLEKSANFDSFMEYQIAAGWKEVPGNAGVYYRAVGTSPAVIAADQSYDVLLNDTVTVKDSVKKEDMNALTSANYPTLKVTAYAVQQEGFAEDKIADAWTQAQTATVPAA